MKTIIIFGSHGYNTLGTIHCMAEKGIDLLLLLVKGSRLCNVTQHSRFVKEMQMVDSVSQGLQWLVEHREELKGSVIYPTSDGAESELDNHYDTLCPYFSFPNAGEQGGVNRLMDKELQIEMAEKAGLHTLEMFKKVNGEGVKYPCLIKARKSIVGGKGEMKVCQSEKELLAALKDSPFAHSLFVQEYIDKEYDLLLVGCRFANGEVIIPGIFKKERWYRSDGSFGLISTDVNHYFSQLDEAKDFVTSLHYVGPFSIEFGVKDGKAYFYEINLRNDGTSHYFHRAGIYIPYWFYLSCNGALHPYELPHKKSEYCFIDEFGDIANLFSADLSLSKWVADFRKAKVYKFYVSYDKIPFYYLVPRQLLRIAYDLFLTIRSRCRKRRISV